MQTKEHWETVYTTLSKHPLALRNNSPIVTAEKFLANAIN
jgi:hypothetical protein